MKNSNVYERFFEIEDIKMGVDARQMEKNEEGVLHDKVDQDKNHSSYKFAAKFTEIYEDIAKVYPIFARLKKLSKAIAMA